MTLESTHLGELSANFSRFRENETLNSTFLYYSMFGAGLMTEHE